MKILQFFLFFFCVTLLALNITPRIIKGELVGKDEARFHPVVRIVTTGSWCSATVIGKRTLITAAHCAGSGKATMKDPTGKIFQVKLMRHPIYPGQDCDLALGILDSDWEYSVPASISQEKLNIGDAVVLAGYGCTNVGGGASDQKLRRGDATVEYFTGYDVVMKGGSAICYGDSGGASFVEEADGAFHLVAVNSKGNIRNRSWEASLHTEQAKKFLSDTAEKHELEICGLNTECELVPK